ncbi:hypothetical protein HanPSC8_Chr11g0455181 [Helianthus annuus]|nr:hypothetical protein HanPSC8_Chr11g0455181 [Helianthus annuus]
MEMNLGILNHVVMGEPLYADIFRCKKDSGDFLPKSTYETNLLDAVKIASEAAKTSTYFYSKGGSRVVAAESFCAAYLKHHVPTSSEELPKQKTCSGMEEQVHGRVRS